MEAKRETTDCAEEHQMPMLRLRDHILLCTQTPAFTGWIHLLYGTFASLSSLR